MHLGQMAYKRRGNLPFSAAMAYVEMTAGARPRVEASWW